MSGPQENYALVERNLVQATGIVLPARSGAMTGIAADADVYGAVNLHASRVFALSLMRVRFLPTTAAGAAQALGIRFSKVFGFTAAHTGGSGVSCRGHFLAQPLRQDPGVRVPASEMVAVISGTAAITTATYTAPDADEPDFYALSSAGAVLPVIQEDIWPRDGLPTLLEPSTGIVGKLENAMGASLVGTLFIALHGYWQ